MATPARRRLPTEDPRQSKHFCERMQTKLARSAATRRPARATARQAARPPSSPFKTVPPNSRIRELTVLCEAYNSEQAKTCARSFLQTSFVAASSRFIVGTLFLQRNSRPRSTPPRDRAAIQPRVLTNGLRFLGRHVAQIGVHSRPTATTFAKALRVARPR